MWAERFLTSDLQEEDDLDLNTTVVHIERA